ncbi:MAG: TIGR02266 family protein [Sandaracinaceae bacterium]|nr:TIGR02266 family protein [Sandaracinaceae bacterium]
MEDFDEHSLSLDARAAIHAVLHAARNARPQMAAALHQLENESVITPGMDSAMREVVAAVRAMYSVEVGGYELSHSALVEAMNALSKALTLMQKEVTQHDSVQEATERVALTLAMLYPAQQSIKHAQSVEQAMQKHAASDDGAAIPLSTPRRRSATVSDARVRADLVFTTPTGPGSERRISPRAEIEVDIGFQSDTNFFVGIAGDLSDGGLFIATQEALPIGTELTIAMVLPGGHHITAHGKVAWTRRGEAKNNTVAGMGVSFTELGKSDARVVGMFLHRREPLRVKP